jgi:hypothetical protein
MVEARLDPLSPTVEAIARIRGLSIASVATATRAEMLGLAEIFARGTALCQAAGPHFGAIVSI